jgi:hypothetical protein
VQAIDRHPCRVPVGVPLPPERHRPGLTPLYRPAQQHAASFIVRTEASTGTAMRRFIRGRFDAGLECALNDAEAFVTSPSTWNGLEAVGSAPLRGAEPMNVAEFPM